MKIPITVTGLKPDVIVERTCRVTFVIDGDEALWLAALIGNVDVKSNPRASFLHELHAEMLSKLGAQNVPRFHERFAIRCRDDENPLANAFVSALADPPK